MLPSPDNSARTCLVCHAPANYSYFGAIVCISCKMFFRRYAEIGQVKFQCAWNEQCVLDPNNRRICSACRLAKCFESGMSAEKIRACRAQPRKILKAASKIVPVSNESFLSDAQQTLLKNLVRCFDENSGLTSVSEFQHEQNSLPMKLRYRHLPVRRFFTTLISQVQRVFEKTRDFHSLSGEDRSTLLHTTTRYTSIFAGIFLLRSSELFDDPSFYQSVEMTFRPAAASSMRRVLTQLDADDTLIKLHLASLAFSSTNSPVFNNRTPTILINSKTMLAIEEMYIDLTWRYLLSNCGEEQAVKRFSQLMRCLLLVNEVVIQVQCERQFEDILEQAIRTIEEEWRFTH